MSHLLEALKRLDKKASDKVGEQQEQPTDSLSSVEIAEPSGSHSEKTIDTLLLQAELIESSVDSVVEEVENEAPEQLVPIEAELAEPPASLDHAEADLPANETPRTQNEESANEVSEENISSEVLASQPSEMLVLADLTDSEPTETVPRSEPKLEVEEHEVIETTDADQTSPTSTLVQEQVEAIEQEPAAQSSQSEQDSEEVQESASALENTLAATEPVDETDDSQDVHEENTKEEGNIQQSFAEEIEPVELLVEDNYQPPKPEATRAPVVVPPVQTLATLAETLTRSSVTVRVAEPNDFEKAIQQALNDPGLRPHYDQLACEVASKMPPEVPVSVLFAAIDRAEATQTVAAAATLIADYSLGKVLLIDADSKTKNLTVGFDLADAAGLSESLRDEQDWRRLTAATSQKGLHILPSGREGFGNWSELASRFAVLTREISNKFQFILIDGGDASESATQGLGRFCDLTYLVLDMCHADSDHAESVAAKLRTAGNRLAGCVVVGTANAA